MYKDFTPAIMRKVSNIFKEMENSIEVKDKNTWVRAKANLWIIVDDLCDRFESIHEEFNDLKKIIEKKFETKD